MQNLTRKVNKIRNSIFNREKKLAIFGRNFEIEERCKGVHFVDLVKSFPTNIYYLLATIGFDTAENEPFEVC